MSWVEEQPGTSLLLSRTGHTISSCGWTDGSWGRVGCLESIGKRVSMWGQSPVVPLRIRGHHRRGHGQAWLGFSKAIWLLSTEGMGAAVIRWEADIRSGWLVLCGAGLQWGPRHCSHPGPILLAWPWGCLAHQRYLAESLASTHYMQFLEWRPEMCPDIGKCLLGLGLGAKWPVAETLGSWIGDECWEGGWDLLVSFTDWWWLWCGRWENAEGVSSPKSLA